MGVVRWSGVDATLSCASGRTAVASASTRASVRVPSMSVKTSSGSRITAASRDAASKRLDRSRRLHAEALATSTGKRAEPRVPFGQVVERGMLRPGEELYSIGNRHKAKVRADGSLTGGDIKGSIHQVGAKLEGAPSCNGWTYWHFKREGKMIPIDALRQQIRDEMDERPN